MHFIDPLWTAQSQVEISKIQASLQTQGTIPRFLAMKFSQTHLTVRSIASYAKMYFKDED